MATKRSAIERTLRKAQSVIASYIKPGRRSAEASIDELLRVLHDTRVTLTRTAKKARRSATKRVSTAKRQVSTKANGVARRSAASARKRVVRKGAAKTAAAKRGRKRARN